MRLLFVCALLCIATISNSQVVRLIGQTNYHLLNGNVQLTDTTLYYYSSDNAWITDTALIDAITPTSRATSWAADSTLMQANFNGQLLDKYRVIQEFDTSDKLTVLRRTDLTTTTHDHLYHYHYTNSKPDTTIWDKNVNNVWEHYLMATMTYTQDLPDSNKYYIWYEDSSAYRSEALITYSYTSGMKTAMEEFIWDGSDWTPTWRTLYAYTGNNLTSDTMQEFTDTGWKDHELHVYVYDINDDLAFQESYTWNTTGNNAWNYGTWIVRNYDADHNLLRDSLYSMGNGDTVGTRVILYTYNAHDLVTSAHTLLSDGSGGFYTWHRDFLYYEEYDPASSVNTARKNTTLQIYPDPASNTINIRSLAEQRDVFSITIFDATGRSVKHWNEPPSTFYQKQVDVSSLPSGNYFLRISDRPQEAVRFTILK